MLDMLRQAGQWASQKLPNQPPVNAVDATAASPGANSPGMMPTQSWGDQFTNRQPAEINTVATQERGLLKPAVMKPALQDGLERVRLFKNQAKERLSQTLHGPKPQLPSVDPQASFQRPGLQAGQAGAAQPLLPTQKKPLKDRLAQKLGLKKDLPAQPAQSPYRARQLVMKDFPYTDLRKVPRFTLTPEEVAVNAQGEKLLLIHEDVADMAVNTLNFFDENDVAKALR